MTPDEIREFLKEHPGIASAQSYNKVEESCGASRALDSDIEIPAPAGLEYLPFQRAGIAYALRKFGVIK
jgi:hypothetical protein